MREQCTCSIIARCEPTAPFGVPVVPEVYRIVAAASGFIGVWRTIGVAASASASRRATGAPPSSSPSGARTVASGTPARAAAGAASASMGAAATTRSASASARTNAISSALNSRWIGTTTAPRDRAA